MRKKQQVYLFSLLVATIAIFALYLSIHVRSLSRVLNSTVTSSATPIPPSSDEAKQYISKASSEAANNDYSGAKKTLQEAITKFPNDLNLKLTLEYYETQALQHTK